MAIHNGCEAFAIYEGYDGLVKGGDMIKQMGWEDVRGTQTKVKGYWIHELRLDRVPL